MNYFFVLAIFLGGERGKTDKAYKLFGFLFCIQFSPCLDLNCILQIAASCSLQTSAFCATCWFAILGRQTVAISAAFLVFQSEYVCFCIFFRMKKN